MSNLNLDQLSPSQSSKEATINQAIAELESAMTEMVTYDLTSNFTALLIDEQRATRLHCTGVPSGGTTLTLVAVKRALIISNASTSAGTLTVAMGSTTVTILPGIRQPVYCDGTTNGLGLVGGSGLPTGGADGQVLTKVAGVPAWSGTPLALGTTSGAHKNWRMRVTASQQTEVAEFVFRSAPGGTATTGTGFAGNASSGSGEINNDVTNWGPARAFDGNTATTWMSRDIAVNNVVGMIFTTAVDIAEAVVTPAAAATLAPAGVVFEWSDDSTNGFDGSWNTAWTTTFTSWTGGTAKTSTDPSYGTLPPAVEKRKNYALNPAIQFAQEYGNAAQTGVAATRWLVDGFWFSQSQSALVTTHQQVLSNTPGGSPYRLRLTVTTGATASPAAGDAVSIQQRLDGADIADLLQGASGAKPLIVRFGFKGPAGTYGFRINSSGNLRNYVAAFTITSGQANTDTLQTFIIPGDTAATWQNTEGTIGLVVLVVLLCGTTGQTSSLNIWTSTLPCIAPNTITNNLATAGAIIELFDFGIYAGTVLPDFVVPDYALEQRRCQRYFQSYPVAGGTTPNTSCLNTASLATGAGVSTDYFFPAPMRATPTITLANVFNVNCATPTANAGGSDKTKVRFNTTATAASTSGLLSTFTWKADARP